jgi:ABC-type oligopeptide transport system ATPase subunit
MGRVLEAIGGERMSVPKQIEAVEPAASVVDGKPLLRARGLSVEYHVRGRGRGRGSQKKRVVSAVDDVDLAVAVGETLGLVGESGCGKTTIGRALIGRVPLTAGTIEFDGRDVTGSSKRKWRELHRDMQLIFQDPYGSMNRFVCITSPRVTSSAVRSRSCSTWCGCRKPPRIVTRTHSQVVSGNGS